jgi:hypothetical protein
MGTFIVLRNRNRKLSSFDHFLGGAGAQRQAATPERVLTYGSERRVPKDVKPPQPQETGDDKTNRRSGRGVSPGRDDLRRGRPMRTIYV